MNCVIASSAQNDE